MSDDVLKRPRSVTLACVFLGVSCFVALVTTIDGLSQWGSIEMQDALRPTLDSPLLEDAGTTMAELLATLRVLALVLIAVMIAGLVFAVYTARGHQASRIALTGVAVIGGVAYVSGLGFIGLPLAILAYSCAFSLWSVEARTWFAVRNGRPVPVRRVAPTPPLVPVMGGTSATESADSSVAHLPPPTVPAAMAQRPPTVLAAGILTLLASLAVFGFSVLYVLVYGLMEADLTDAMVETMSGWDRQLIEDSLRLMFQISAVAVLPALVGVAAGIAVLTPWRGGRRFAIAMAWMTLGLCAAAIGVGQLGALLFAIAATAVVILLNRPDVRAWYGSRRPRP